MQGVSGSAYSILCKSKICETAYLQKQSTGLFLNSPFAERLNALQDAALHPPEALPLDSAKGITLKYFIIAILDNKALMW